MCKPVLQKELSVGKCDSTVTSLPSDCVRNKLIIALGTLLCSTDFFFFSPKGLSHGRNSVQFSCSVVSDTLGPHGLQHARLPCPSPTPGSCSNTCPLCRWCQPTISFSATPSPPTFNLSQHQGLFKWVSSSHQLAKVLEFQLQHQSFQWKFRTNFLFFFFLINFNFNFL